MISTTGIGYKGESIVENGNLYYIESCSETSSETCLFKLDIKSFVKEEIDKNVESLVILDGKLLYMLKKYGNNDINFYESSIGTYDINTKTKTYGKELNEQVIDLKKLKNELYIMSVDKNVSLENREYKFNKYNYKENNLQYITTIDKDSNFATFEDSDLISLQNYGGKNLENIQSKFYNVKTNELYVTKRIEQANADHIVDLNLLGNVSGMVEYKGNDLAERKIITNENIIKYANEKGLKENPWK